MSAAKDEVRKILEQLPESTSLEDIQYQIHVRQKIDRGLEDVASGRTITEEEAEARLARWTER